MGRAEPHPGADRVVAAARRLVGTPFRPQGRDEGGLDCLGVALAAARGAGIERRLPAFALRGTGLGEGEAWLRRCGCRAVPLAEAMAGDILLQVPAAVQLHLAVRTENGLIEAHAGLGRVVERPIGPTERWMSCWRLPVGED
jgi:hypothetical protein